MCGPESTTARKQIWFCPWGRSNFVHRKVLGRVWELLEHLKRILLHHSKARYHRCKSVKRSETRILVPETNSNIDTSWFWKAWGSFRAMNRLESLHVWLIKMWRCTSQDRWQTRPQRQLQNASVKTDPRKHETYEYRVWRRLGECESEIKSVKSWKVSPQES